MLQLLNGDGIQLVNAWKEIVELLEIQRAGRGFPFQMRVVH